jgi:1-acyl-sn-glycerol-3-phosphate acyltransferase
VSWVPPRVFRRLIIDPLWVPVAAGLGVLLLVTIIVSGLIAPFTRKRRVLRAALLASVYLYMDVGLMLASFVLWLRRPSPLRDERAWRAQHARLLGRALSTLMPAARTLFGYQVELVGRPLDVDANQPLIVLARHAGPGDSFTLVHLLTTKYDRIPRVVLKQLLQWDPGLDVVLTRLDCYFLPSKSGAGEDRTAAVADLTRRLGPGDALLLFPEGGNWTPRRHRRAIIRLRRAGKQDQARRASTRTHVLPPKPGGTVAALACRPDTNVLVLAHAGLDTLINPRQMWRALPLRNRPMRIRSWLHPASSVPREQHAIPAWLEEQWATLDQWIATEPRQE